MKHFLHFFSKIKNAFVVCTPFETSYRAYIKLNFYNPMLIFLMLLYFYWSFKKKKNSLSGTIPLSSSNEYTQMCFSQHYTKHSAWICLSFSHGKWLFSPPSSTFCNHTYGTKQHWPPLPVPPASRCWQMTQQWIWQYTVPVHCKLVRAWELYLITELSLSSSTRTLVVCQGISTIFCSVRTNKTCFFKNGTGIVGFLVLCYLYLCYLTWIMESFRRQCTWCSPRAPSTCVLVLTLQPAADWAALPHRLLPPSSASPGSVWENTPCRAVISPLERWRGWGWEDSRGLCAL